MGELCILVSAGPERIAVAEAALHRSSFRVLVGSSRSAADDLARRAASQGPGLDGVQRYSWLQLVQSLALPTLAKRGRVPVASSVLDALLVRTVSAVAGGGGLDFFGEVAFLPNFPRVVGAVLRDLRMNQIGAPRLLRGSPASQDLARLLTEFELQLGTWSLADFPMVLEAATQSLAGNPLLCPGISVLLLDCLPSCIREQRFLQRLGEIVSSLGGSLTATVPACDRSSIEKLEKALGVVARRCDCATLQDCSKPLNRQTKLSRLRLHLSDQQSLPTACGNDSSFEFISAPGEGREAVEIARRVLDLARRGTRFDEIAVAVRNPGLYQPHLAEAFRRARIPVWFSSGVSRPDPAGRAFLALLECAGEGLSAERFAEYLSLGQVPSLALSGEAEPGTVAWAPPLAEDNEVMRDEAAPGETPAVPAPEVPGTAFPRTWERFMRQASVVGSKERWERRLNGLEAEWLLQLEDLGESSARAVWLMRDLQRLREFRRFALPLVALLDEFPPKANWGEWLDLLSRLARRCLRSPESVLGVLGQLLPMASVGPVGLPEVRAVLDARLASLRIRPTGSRYGKVLVGAPSDILGRVFTAVFVPGLAEGIFPQRVSEQACLLDNEIARLELPLETRRTKIQLEAVLLARIISVAREYLVVSYPRLDIRTGSARVPSLLAFEVLRAAEGRLPDEREISGAVSGGEPARLGWPAPRERKLAIDPTEYDLSVLEPVLDARIPAVPGSGRYLLEVNPWLARSLRSRFKRWKRDWSDDDGLVQPRETLVSRILEANRLTARSYSPTSLQLFTACPFRFYLQAVLQLAPREPTHRLEQLSPLTRGSLFHQVQARFFEEASRRDLLPFTPDHLHSLLDCLEQVLSVIARDQKERLAPALPRIWESEVEEMRIDLRCWIRDVIQAGEPWVPINWELGFGLSDSGDGLTASETGEVILEKGYRIKGAIDLVERHASENLLRVVDHKTGRPPDPFRVTGGGRYLQPLLYGLAAEALNGSPAGSGQLFYCTQKGGFQRRTVSLDWESREKGLEVLEIIDRYVSAGFLPAAPAEGECGVCPYVLVCGPYEEIRAARKSQAELRDLERLRRMP